MEAQYPEGWIAYGIFRKARTSEANKNTNVRAMVMGKENVSPKNPGEKACDTIAPPFLGEIQPLEVLYPPGNPATISFKDLGQRLCVPLFRVVCLFQAYIQLISCRSCYKSEWATIMPWTIFWDSYRISICYDYLPTCDLQFDLANLVK